MVFKLPKLFGSYPDWLEKQQTSILSAATIITVANILSSVSGFFRTRLLIGQFFDTPLSQQSFEAFQVASQIPDLMFQLLILGAVSAAFIPIFTSYKKLSEREAFEMTSGMMNILLLAFAVVAVVVFIFAEPFTRWRTGSAFTPEQLIVATNLTRVMLAAQFFFGVSNFLTGMLQSYQRFLLPALSPIIYNVGILVGVFLFAPYIGIYAAGLGVVMGAFFHMAIQLPTVYRLGFRWRPVLKFKHSGIRQMLRLTPARTLTMGIGQVQQLAIGFFTTSLGNLSFVVVNLAFSLMTVPIRFFGVPISQAALPFLSAESDKDELSTFRDLLLKSLHQIAFFAYPASVLLLILRIPVVRLAFGTHNFPWATTVLTGKVVAIISLSITAQAITQLLVRAFYALKNTRIPLYVTIVTVGLFMISSWISIFFFQTGLVGLAVASTVSNILEMFAFLYFLNRRVKGITSKAFWIPQLKMIVASFLMAVFLYLPFRILDRVVFNTSQTIELLMLTITTSTIGMVVYIYFAMLFDVEELYMIRKIADKLGTWKKTLAKSQEVILDSPVQSEEI